MEDFFLSNSICACVTILLAQLNYIVQKIVENSFVSITKILFLKFDVKFV